MSVLLTHEDKTVLGGEVINSESVCGEKYKKKEILSSATPKMLDNSVIV